jgi:hypothetical protein
MTLTYQWPQLQNKVMFNPLAEQGIHQLFTLRELIMAGEKAG